MENLAREVIDTVCEQEREVRDKDGRWYSLRARPYITVDNKMDGAVLVLVDTTDLKRGEQQIKGARNYAEATIRTARDPLIVLRGDLRVNTANEAFYKTFKTTPDQTEGRLIYDLGNEQWKIPKLRTFLKDILPRNSLFNDFEVTHDFPRIGRRTMLLNGRRLDIDDGTPPMILLAIEDITERQRASEATTQLAAIVQTSEDAIFAKTVEGVIASWNPGAERMFGYSMQEILGKNVSMLIPPQRESESEPLFERLRRGERVANFETERMRKNGSIICVSLSLAPLVDKTGRLTSASVIARDITERKRAADQVRASEIRYRRLFESAHDGVLILDSVSRKITDANPLMTELLGYTREELLGTELWQIGLLKDEPSSHAAFRELQQRGQIRYEDLPLQTKSGEKRAAKDALSNEAIHLGQLVTERTADLMATNKQLEAFVYSIAHDLRAPLRAMQGFSSMLVDEAGGALSESGQNYARRIDKSAQFMDALLRDLLAFSRISQQRLELISLKLETVVESVLSHLESEIEEKKARVETSGPWPMVRAHKPTLAQVLFNLVSNSLKFVAPDIPPQMRVRAEEQSESVRVWVEDNGIGIAPDRQEQIFRLFMRLHGEKYQGTGVGLAIVQKRVERMGGQMGVESADGQGSRFWIELKKA